ncbi:MAG: hypothetical protein V1744_02955 [Candidatus Altiarchaeota archaeon]
MDSRENIKADLSELVKAYASVSSIIMQLRDETVLNPHDCDNLLGHLKSGLIEDVLLYTRANITQPLEKNALKTMKDYLMVKKSLERQNLSQEDMKEVLSLFFKK